MNVLDDLIGVFQILLINGLCLRFRIFIDKVNLRRHETAVFLDGLANLVLIAVFQAVLGDMECDERSCFLPRAGRHLVIRAAVACPVYRFRTVSIA